MVYIEKILGLFIHEIDEQGEEDDDALKSATASSAQSLFPNRKKDAKDGGGKPKIKFADVRGIDDFKEELEEIVAFLKAPELFEMIGAKLPMGVLMAGPPGVGKTMLAKAIAGEADCSFYYAAGSQFEEKYVGVGAKRIRMLFEEAKKNAPSIIFIDEIDAVASRRNPEFYSGNSSTLNQLLAEMDGFQSKGKVVVIGATNMPELLDPAISRPGRFDKTIHISAPDYKGRYEILQYYLEKVKVHSSVSLENLARRTVRFSGAELRNFVNQAVINAVKLKKGQATDEDFDEAYDKIVLGVTRRGMKGGAEEIRATAYHEGRSKFLTFSGTCFNGRIEQELDPSLQGDHSSESSVARTHCTDPREG